MATVSWFADSAVLTIRDTTGTTTNNVPVAILQEVEFTPSFEHVELYGMESIKRAAVAKHSMKVNVTAKFAAWDPQKDYIMWSVLNGTFTTTSTTGVNDSGAYRNKEALFCLVATVTESTNAASTLTITATGVYFTEVPFKLTQHEFIVRDLKGTASDISFVYGSV
jgi:hypothetical protein